jgi:hypothetical protein
MSEEGFDKKKYVCKYEGSSRPRSGRMSTQSASNACLGLWFIDGPFAIDSGLVVSLLL